MGTSPAQNAFPPGQELLLVLAAHCSMGGTVAAQLGSSGQVFLAPRSHVFSTKHLPYLGHQDCQVLAVFSFLLKFTALCGVKISPLQKADVGMRGHTFMAANPIFHW